MIFEDNNSLEAKAVISTYKAYFKTYKWCRDEMLIEGYICILESNKDLTKMTEEEKFKHFRTRANAGMQKFKKEIEKQNNIFSLNQTMHTESEELELQETIKEKKDESERDIDFLINNLKALLKQYSKNERGKILNYIITSNKPKEPKSRELIKDFQKKYFKILVDKDYLQEKDKDLYLNEEKRKNKNKYKILELIKENNISTEEIAELLNIEESKVQRILEQKQNNQKFYLHQVQKLREKYFKDYSLEDLTECLD